MKKNKKAIFKYFIIPCFVLILLSIFLVFLIKKHEKYIEIFGEYNLIEEEGLKEAKKYDKILENESIKDIYDYLVIDLDNNMLFSTVVMDYIFENLYVKATANEKFNLFYLYYYNMSCLEDEYTEYLKNPYNLQWLNLNYNGYDLNSLEGISKIKDRPILRSTLINMKVNGLKIFNNYPSMEAQFDYDLFIDKFEDILDKEYIDYCKLLSESQTVILNPGGQSFNYLGEIWYLHNFETFIKNCDNIYLKGAAQDIYEQNLALFFGQYDDSLFYSDTSSYVVNNNLIITLNSYLELYPNDSTAILCEKALDLIETNNGKYDIIDTLNSYINQFINDANWLPKDPSTNDFSDNKIIEFS